MQKHIEGLVWGIGSMLVFAAMTVWYFSPVFA